MQVDRRALVLVCLFALFGLPVRAPVPIRPAAAPPVRVVAGVFDPVAIVPMFLVATYMSVQSLFVIFAPVYAREHGIPIEQLGIYYPVYGVVVLIAHLSLGRVSDRFGRRHPRS
jgi:predicted MFS family arabinose efflux permease